ncbi:MAG: hypothetical protein VKJ24_08360 [Synechococcales bacterium]|nr:hypothetical protein [Synechococcales bacterium]
MPKAPKPKPSSNPTSSPATASSPILSHPTVAKVLETVTPIAQQTWRQSRPTLIQLLRALTQQLQKLTQKLETQTIADPTPVQPINWTPMVQTTTRLSQTLWEKLQPLWRLLLDKLRPILPEAFRPLSDRTISGILAGSLLLLFWLTSSIPVGQAKPVPPSTPAIPSQTASKLPQPTRSNRSAKPQPGVLPDAQPNTFPTDLSAPQASPAIAPLAPGKPVRSVPPSSTTASSAGSTPKIVPSPAPVPIKLTPTQKLQETVETIAAEYDLPLKPTLQANFATKMLRITLQPSWYDLSSDRQDSLVATLWQKAQTAKLNSLEIVDNQGQTVARSPVVGNEMVILQRGVSKLNS